jgi:N-methylhydantoinase A
MVAFGGAGPLHAVEVARELHIPTVIIPNVPGQFSAAGMLVADLKHDYVQTFHRELTAADLGELDAIAETLVAEGRRVLEHEGVPESETEFRRVLEIRYVGQDFAIPVAVDVNLAEGDDASIRSAFNDIHQRQFGYRDDERPVEIVNVRVTAIGHRRRHSEPRVAASGEKSEPGSVRDVVFDHAEPLECPVFERERLTAGQRIEGPAVIQEYGSTTLLSPGDVATVAESGEIVILVRSR